MAFHKHILPNPWNLNMLSYIGKETLQMQVAKLRILRWEISPDYPDGIDVIINKGPYKEETGGLG